jgi:hypothetical protein
MAADAAMLLDDQLQHGTAKAAGDTCSEQPAPMRGTHSATYMAAARVVAARLLLGGYVENYLVLGCVQVVELGGAKVLVVETEGEVYAVSNKCSHLGLPLVGE